MVLVKKLASWIIWLMIIPLITFILSYVFDFPYWYVVRSLPYRFIYGFASVVFSMVYIVISDDDKSLDFFR